MVQYRNFIFVHILTEILPEPGQSPTENGRENDMAIKKSEGAVRMRRTVGLFGSISIIVGTIIGEAVFCCL